MRKGLSYYQAKAIEHLDKNYNTADLKGKAVQIGFKGQNMAKSYHEAEELQNKSNQYRSLAHRVDCVREAISNSVTKSELFKIMKSNKELFKEEGRDLPFTLELVKEIYPADPQRNSFKKIKKIAVKKSVLASMFQDQEKEVKKSCLDSEYHEPEERFSDTVRNILSGKKV